MMASIRGRNTAPEVALRSAIHRLGLRFRLHCAGLPGRPDVVLPRHRAVVFVHGCFWHRHPGCRLAYSPAEILPPLSETDPPKGMAEVVMIAVVPAIVNAVAHAIGKRFYSLPITPEKIREALA